MVGLKTGRWLQNIGALGTYLPGILLVGLRRLGRSSPGRRRMSMPLESLIPDLEQIARLNLWASIAFAFAGLELCAVLGGEVKDPRRTLPRSILISGSVHRVPLYRGHRLGALAGAGRSGEHRVRVPPGHGGRGPGHRHRRRRGSPPVAAALYVLGNIGGVGAWLTGPARVAFVIGLDRYFPPAFGGYTRGGRRPTSPS